MRRRDVISVLARCAVLWPVAVFAQRPAQIARVGVLLFAAEHYPQTQAIVKTFTEALARLGWVEGWNIHIDYRFAAGDPARYKHFAAELVALAPNALLAAVAPAVLALRARTNTIPIVFVLVPDPVGLGIVQSLGHPGGNITGFTSYDAPIIGKWLQLLKELVPGITRVAIMFNPDTAFAPPLTQEIEAAKSFGVAATLARVHNVREIMEAIADLGRKPGGGLICLPDSFNVAHRDTIISAATSHGLPVAGVVDFVKAGGLMSYWFDIVELFAPAAGYIDCILKGAKPADLPVQYPTKYSLIINLKTAKALGLAVPPLLLAQADEIIE
jgi:putative tryptophan/tyrosine transport system substrate-binding protein